MNEAHRRGREFPGNVQRLIHRGGSDRRNVRGQQHGGGGCPAGDDLEVVESIGNVGESGLRSVDTRAMARPRRS